MMSYAKIIDNLADKIYSLARKKNLNHYDLGQLQAYKDLRLELIDLMIKELNNYDDTAIDSKK